MWRCLFLLALLPAGCKARDGDTLRQASRKAGEKLRRAAAPASEAATPLGDFLNDGSLAARVEWRIRHDRYLAGQRFGVRADAGGVVTLSGTVPEATLRTRALELARSTLGVEKVVDEVKLAGE